MLENSKKNDKKWSSKFGGKLDWTYTEIENTII